MVTRSSPSRARQASRNHGPGRRDISVHLSDYAAHRQRYVGKNGELEIEESGGLEEGDVTDDV
jgi:hypothetical protein